MNASFTLFSLKHQQKENLTKQHPTWVQWPANPHFMYINVFCIQMLDRDLLSYLLGKNVMATCKQTNGEKLPHWMHNHTSEAQ